MIYLPHHDNAPLYKARSINKWFGVKEFDLNPTHQRWDELQH